MDQHGRFSACGHRRIEQRRDSRADSNVWINVRITGSLLRDQRIEQRSDPHAIRTVQINVHITMSLLFALTSTLICARVTVC